MHHWRYCAVCSQYWYLTLCIVMICVVMTKPLSPDYGEENAEFINFIPSPPITTDDEAIFNCSSKGATINWLVWGNDGYAISNWDEIISLGVITNGAGESNSSLIIPGHLTQFNNTRVYCIVFNFRNYSENSGYRSAILLIQEKQVNITFIPSPPITKVEIAIYNCSSNVSSITIQWFIGNSLTPTHINYNLISAGVITHGAATTTSSLIIPGHLAQPFNNTLIHCVAGGHIGGPTGTQVNEVQSAPLLHNNYNYNN